MVQKIAPSAADIFAQALVHHRAGRLGPAEHLYRQALTLQPRNTQALSGLGLIAAQTGHLQPARDLLSQALATAPRDPDCLVNLAKVDINLGDIAGAAELLGRAVAARKRDAVAWNLLGWCRQRLGRLDEALVAFRTAVRHNPDFGEALNNLGTALMLRGETAEAVKILRKCIVIAPTAAQPYMNLGILLGSEGRSEEALAFARKAVELAPKAADAHFNLAKLLHQLDQLEEAETEYRAAIALQPGNPHFLNNLALMLDGLLKTDEALAMAERAAAAATGVGEIHENLIRAYIGCGRFADARERLEEYLSRVPDHSGMRLLSADILVREGRFEDAKAVYLQLLDEDPDNARALRGYARSRKIRVDDPLFHRMRTVAETAAESSTGFDDDRVDLFFALGKAHDDIGQPDLAFPYYARANALKNAVCRYDPPAWEDHVAAVIETFSPAFFAERSGWGSHSERPVMILGMPRSGTTLVEQIVSSHPDVAAGDELPDFNLIERMFKRRYGYPQQLREVPAAELTQYVDLYLDHLTRIDATAARVTDKLPGNSTRLGLIALLFPKARVLHCRRNPVDTCLSIFFQNFGGHHDYGYDLRHIGHFYRHYEQLMEHWKRVVPTPILDVVYEDVVADYETQSRRMIEHVGLPWHQAMARHTENKRTVSTASVWQVRQPIYKGSVERWRKYEAHIGPLLEVLGVQA
ncbi:tetratricopeptide repeat protein [Caenispirillum bisanense]|uniref:tetratricopeptide repeat protein n=1 Tax=Caenispirillum bisanense TaxID=414052 RepID=UPI0031DAC257